VRRRHRAPPRRRPRSRASTLFTPQPPPLSAHQVFDDLHEPPFALLSCRVCVPTHPRHRQSRWVARRGRGRRS
jgi:hypothetical protein